MILKCSFRVPMVWKKDPSKKKMRICQKDTKNCVRVTYSHDPDKKFFKSHSPYGIFGLCDEHLEKVKAPEWNWNPTRNYYKHPLNRVSAFIEDTEFMVVNEEIVNEIRKLALREHCKRIVKNMFVRNCYWELTPNDWLGILEDAVKEWESEYVVKQ